MTLFRAVVLLCMISGSVDSSISWSYWDPNGPDNWAERGITTCDPTGADTQTQSPIDIASDYVDLEIDADMGEVVFTGHFLSSAYLPYRNTGSQVLIKIGDDFMQTTISGGGLEMAYKLFQIYFHWGSVDTQGSEHRIDGRAYPMEVQFVYYDASLTSEADYNDHRDTPEGVEMAAVGILFEISDTDTTNDGFESFINSITNGGLNPHIYKTTTHFEREWEGQANHWQRVIVEDVHAYSTMESFDLNGLLPTDRRTFARYSGTSTFPGCGNMLWTVFKEPIPISSAQMDRMRTTFDRVNEGEEDSTYIVDNYRPDQPLNDRTVVVSGDYFFYPGTTTTTTTAAANEQGNSNNENAQAVEFGDSTSRATLQHASLCVILVALVAVCQLF